MKPAFLCNRKLRCNFLLHKKAPRGRTDRNLVSEHGGKTDKTYTYNESNKLITATVTNGNDVTIESYTYDYEGNRVTKQINEDNKNSITDTYCYDAYGNLLQKTGDTENDYLYTGEQYNANKGIVVQTLITCTATALFGELAASILKVVGIAQDTIGFVDAVKIGDPEEILVAALRLAVSVFTLKCQCFTGDTLVSTEDGDRRIDEIQAGDYVWAYNTETGERELKKVLSTPVIEIDILVHVGLSDGTEIRTTMLHPFYVKTEDGGEWVAASNLTKGDDVLTEDGRVVYVENVQVEKLDKKIKVYNLEIEDLHTYFVAGGVLVHNVCDEVGSDSLWNQAKNNNSLWKKGKLKIHFEKHGGDFGASTSAEYSRMALDFGKKKSAVILQTENGPYVYRFDPSTNEVFVGTKASGIIKNYYK